MGTGDTVRVAVILFETAGEEWGPFVINEEGPACSTPADSRSKDAACRKAMKDVDGMRRHAPESVAAIETRTIEVDEDEAERIYRLNPNQAVGHVFRSAESMTDD